MKMLLSAPPRATHGYILNNRAKDRICIQPAIFYN